MKLIDDRKEILCPNSSKMFALKGLFESSISLDVQGG
jgi:hypothetical protein